MIVPATLLFVKSLAYYFFDKQFYLSDGITGIWFSQFIGYYILGYYLSNKKITDREKNISIIVGILTVIFTVIVQCIYKAIYNNNILIIDDACMITTTILAISLFIVCKYYLNNNFTSDKLNNMIANISNCVFGIYLFHPFVIIFLYNTPLFTWLFGFNAYIALILLIIVVFVFLLLVIYLVRKIPIVRKFL